MLLLVFLRFEVFDLSMILSWTEIVALFTFLVHHCHFWSFYSFFLKIFVSQRTSKPFMKKDFTKLNCWKTCLLWIMMNICQNRKVLFIVEGRTGTYLCHLVSVGVFHCQLFHLIFICAGKNQLQSKHITIKPQELF